VARTTTALAPERLTSGPHFAAFTETYCRHTMQVPDGPPIGSPFILEHHQKLFWDEALELDPVTLRRVYSRAGRIQPRKTGKTTELAAFSEYAGGPFDGEHRPTVILAAGSKDQAGELFDQAKAFIDDPQGGSPELRALFVPRMTSITCPSVGGVIRLVAGDGKLNHSLNPHVVVADELHAWKTKRQRENWKALTTAQGAREDPMVVFITTEGEDEDDELFDLMERITDDPNTEVEVVHRCFTIYRNRAAGLLVHRYGCPPDTPLTDIGTIKMANPASWRTEPRLAQDLVDPLVDENTKRRLYMGIRVAGSGRWISDARIEQASTAREIPPGVVIAGGADAAKTHDTTAVGWAWIDSKTGECLVDCHVWSCRQEVAADTYVEGGRLDNNDARDYIRDVLLKRFSGRLLFYDERYFGTQAQDLSQDGMTVVEMHQGKPEMKAAWNEFYAELHAGRRDADGQMLLQPTLLLPGGERGRTLRSHIRAAKGKRNAAGDSWIVHKEELPIDALAAVVMARYAARHFEDFMPKKRRAVSW
jgi:phage terminase large subunit-like protein